MNSGWSQQAPSIWLSLIRFIIENVAIVIIFRDIQVWALGFIFGILRSLKDGSQARLVVSICRRRRWIIIPRARPWDIISRPQSWPSRRAFHGLENNLPDWPLPWVLHSTETYPHDSCMLTHFPCNLKYVFSQILESWLVERKWLQLGCWRTLQRDRKSPERSVTQRWDFRSFLHGWKYWASDLHKLGGHQRDTCQSSWDLAKARLSWWYLATGSWWWNSSCKGPRASGMTAS